MSPRILAAAVVAGALAAPLTTTTAHANIVDDPIVHSAPDASLALAPIGTFETGIFDESAAEIVAHYAAGQKTLVINAQRGTVQVLDSSDPTAPSEVAEIAAEGVTVDGGGTIPAGAVANSVAVRADGLAVVAVEAPEKTDPGWLLFVDVSGDAPSALGAVGVGALPDSVVLSPDGAYAVVANEGEPAEDYSVDPEGSVGIVSMPEGVEAASAGDVRTAGFRAFDEPGGLPDGVRIYGGREDAGTAEPEFPVAENLEPEYSAVIGEKAYVTLQENNAIAVVDLASAEVERIVPLGTADYSEIPVDVSDRDDEIALKNWPVKSFHQPDTIKAVEIGGEGYLVTANEGDARDWEAYSEEARVKDLGEDGLPPLCESVADAAGMPLEELQADENLGRLSVTTADGLSEDGSCVEQIYGYGSRSFSILDSDGQEVFNSRDGFERITAEAMPDFFNSNHSESNFDGRSDDKGPEPEAIEVGVVGDRTYAFIGFERVGGVMVYDITDPSASEYVTYVNNRDFSHSVEDDPSSLGQAGDLGPESIAFVSADDSPTGEPMLIVGSEVSGTTTYFSVEDLLADPDPTEDPTDEPTDDPSETPTEDPTEDPTDEPSETPTDEPTPGDDPSFPAPTSPGEPSDDPSDDGDDRGDGTLPRTGATVGAAVVAALALVGGGAAMLLAARRRS